MSNHYDVLGVSKKATEAEIKSAFRKLSMETHPDVNDDTDGEAFKKIAEAHSVLSNKNSRWKYDLQLQDEAMWRGGRGGAGGTGGLNNSFYGRNRPHQPQKGTMHALMETVTHPRFVVLGVAAFGGIFVLTALLGGVSSNRPEYHHDNRMVEAWKNPKTGKWEQPAPWDPVYRQLSPKLELVPREKVKKRHISS